MIIKSSQEILDNFHKNFLQSFLSSGDLTEND
jgi:hypothetical protein